MTGYSQPPPTMPNQVSQPRPQTPPNNPTIGIPGTQPISLSHGQAVYSINPAVAAQAAVPNHHMQQPPQAVATPQPHPGVQQSQSGVNPGGVTGSGMQQPPQVMPHATPYVKKPRSRAITIINPETNEVVNADQNAKTTSAAPSEGSPAPSEVSLFCFFPAKL